MRNRCGAVYVMFCKHSYTHTHTRRRNHNTATTHRPHRVCACVVDRVSSCGRANTRARRSLDLLIAGALQNCGLAECALFTPCARSRLAWLGGNALDAQPLTSSVVVVVVVNSSVVVVCVCVVASSTSCECNVESAPTVDDAAMAQPSANELFVCAMASKHARTKHLRVVFTRAQSHRQRHCRDSVSRPETATLAVVDERYPLLCIRCYCCTNI